MGKRILIAIGSLWVVLAMVSVESVPVGAQSEPSDGRALARVLVAYHTRTGNTEQMARGVREHLGSDWAVAVTGIAGPGGGTEEKPVGTTWIAVVGPEGVAVGHYRYSGDRERNRRLAVTGALDALRRALTGLPIFAPEELSWGRPG